MKTILVLIFLFVATFSSAQLKTLSGKSLDPAKLDELIKKKMDSLQMPGLSIAIVNDGKIVYHRALGYADLEAKTKVDEETLFEACSLTKPLFAFFVMRMVDKGVIALDTPIYKYLPNYDLDYDERYKLITPRMVLDHSTGLPNWRTSNRGMELDIKFTPGTKFSYSGEGFEYLANAIAHLQGGNMGNLEKVFQKELADPLGMKYALFTWNDHLAHHKASGYWREDDKGPVVKRDMWKQIIFSAAGGAQTEAVSYATFLIGVMDGKVVKRSSIDEMLREQMRVDDTTRTYRGRGLGFAIEKTPAGPRYIHGGSNGNYTSYMVMDRTRRWAYVYFTNCDRGDDFNGWLKPLLVK